MEVMNHGDWLEKTKGNIMIVATVIAGISFQLMTNIPGGTWEKNKDCPPDVDRIRSCPNIIGTAKLQYNEDKRSMYIAMVVTSVVSFSASINLIILLITSSRLRNRIIIRVMVMLMVVAVLSITLAFYLTVALVHSQEDIVVYIILAFGLLSHGFIVFIQIIVLLVRFIRFLFCG